jgi:hypothetical protein
MQGQAFDRTAAANELQQLLLDNDHIIGFLNELAATQPPQSDPNCPAGSPWTARVAR